MMPPDLVRPLEDTDTHETASAGPDVEAMGSVLEGERELDHGKRALVEDLKRRADRLALATGWERDQFLVCAGCSSAEKVVTGDPKINFLLACLSYLMWVEKILDKLDLPSDRRTAVVELDQLFRDSNKDLQTCKQAMQAKPQTGERSANELLKLGEVTRAFQVALAHTDTEHGQRAKRVLLDDPLYLSSPHVDSERIELAWTEPAVLGEEVAERIRDHVVLCESCTEAYAQRPRRGY